MKPDRFRRASCERYLVWAMTAALMLAGCHDASAPVALGEDHAPPPGFVVSEPSLALGAAVATSAGGEEIVAYVSVAPGTLIDVTSVRIRNVTAGDAVGIPVVLREGGFDPVAISAEPGDRLELMVTVSGGAITTLTFVVPVKRPPVVVRTNPPKGRTDVALSIRPQIVFSEPIDAQSVTSGSVTLLANGTPVPGTAEVVAGTPFTVEFIPAAPLEASTEYQLVLTKAVRDRDGDALSKEFSVDFSTLAGSGTLDLGSIRLVYQRDQWPGPQYLWSMNADGSGVRQLTHGTVWDFAPAVSPDGSRIVFARWVAPPGIDWTSPDLEFAPQIFVMNVDGTGVTQLTQGPSRAYMPSWSPDGAWLAFAARDSVMGPSRIEVIRLDGTGRRVLASGDDYHRPVWSPDGSTLAFFRDGLEEIWAVDAEGRNLRLVRKFVPWGTPPAVQDGLIWTTANNILLVDGETSVWTMNPDGSNLVRGINLQRGDLQFSGSSRDGRLLTLNKLWGVSANPDPTCICPTGLDIHLLNLVDGSLTRATHDSISYGGAFVP